MPDPACVLAAKCRHIRDLFDCDKGFSGRFWTRVLAQTGCALACGVVSAVVVSLLTLSIPRQRVAARYWPKGLAAVIGVLWGTVNWDVVMLYLNRVNSNEVDPILGRDIGFYLFVLPFYDSVVVEWPED